MLKDLFSQQASVYAKYRPTYPKELFDYITGFVEEKKIAWDCATGNGQAAQMLASYFEKVEATDISEAQLALAIKKENIRYRVSPAEKTPFADNSFDLITIATAYHWLDRKAFHKEATRVGKHNCVVAAWAYNVVQSENEALNKIIHYFYRDVVGSYWDKERKHVDESYQNLEFDFSQLPTKNFAISLAWNKEEFLGYLSSWSAVQHYINKRGSSPLSLIADELRKAWPGDDSKEFYFPLFLRIGRITK